jgi:hypothetical protein
VEPAHPALVEVPLAPVVVGSPDGAPDAVDRAGRAPLADDTVSLVAAAGRAESAKRLAPVAVALVVVLLGVRRRFRSG